MDGPGQGMPRPGPSLSSDSAVNSRRQHSAIPATHCADIRCRKCITCRRSC